MFCPHPTNHVEHCQPEEPFEAQVFHFGGTGNDTTDNIKTMIVDKTNLLNIRQGLIDPGSHDDGRTLSDHTVNKSDELHLHLRMSPIASADCMDAPP